MTLTSGMSEVPWPKKPAALPGSDRWERARRKGDFVRESNSVRDEKKREREYRKRRLKCAMAELYVNFGIWLQGDKKQRRPENHLQAAIRAHAALKHLGADSWLRLTDPG